MNISSKLFISVEIMMCGIVCWKFIICVICGVIKLIKFNGLIVIVVVAVRQAVNSSSVICVGVSVIFMVWVVLLFSGKMVS